MAPLHVDPIENYIKEYNRWQNIRIWVRCGTRKDQKDRFDFRKPIIHQENDKLYQIRYSFQAI